MVCCIEHVWMPCGVGYTERYACGWAQVGWVYICGEVYEAAPRLLCICVGTVGLRRRKHWVVRLGIGSIKLCPTAPNHVDVDGRINSAYCEIHWVVLGWTVVRFAYVCGVMYVRSGMQRSQVRSVPPRIEVLCVRSGVGQGGWYAWGAA